MAPTTTQEPSLEDEGPDSHNIWDKTFKICDRYDSNASVVFTDVTEDSGSFAASQQDTLDSFFLKGEASAASSPLSRSPALDPQNPDKAAAENSQDSPEASSNTCTVAGKLPNGTASSVGHQIQLSEKQMAKLDSLADETISVLSTTAVAGSVASAASLDGDLDARTARRRSTETVGRSSTQTDAPELLTVETAVSEASAEPEEKEKGQELAGEDLYLLTPKKQGEDRSAEGVETPPEEEEADPAKGFELLPAEKKSYTTQDGSGEGSNQEGKTAPAQPEAKGIETLPEKEEAGPEEAASNSKKDGQINDSPEVKGTITPTEAEEASPTKAASEEGIKQTGEIESPLPEALEQTLSKEQESSVAAQSPATPETATPALGNAEESSQDSDPSTNLPTPMGSSSSLNPVSEPFIPSKGAQQDSQRTSKAAAHSNKPLNAQATAFVPGKPSAVPPASVSVSGRPSFTPLQFGDLPDSLNASPHPTSQDQAEWSRQYNSYHGPEREQGEWHGDWAEYGYSGYGDQAYSQPNGNNYYGQEDGSWTYGEQHNSQWGGWNETNGDANGWDYDTDEAANGYSHQNANELADDSQGYRRRPRAGRGFKRIPERRRGYDGPRGSWGDAAVDILEQQFGYSRDALQEMLELHEGNLEIALDMLAQLEAEKDGQLPASGQDAPELNEENFPSLGSCGSSKSQQPSPKKTDFAAAVRTPSSAPQTPHSVDKKAFPSPPAQATPKAQKQPWAETGAAVSELYENARADAKDHARLRNHYFQEATKAYMAGSKALAKDLGAKGREQSELMKAAHVSASQAIYKHRNPISGRSKGKSPGLIDLHGLHVKEALSTLEEQIEAVRRLKPKTSRAAPHRLSVLVGTGHHTKGVRTPARLPSAVEEWLKASQIPFSAPEPGILELSV